MTNYKHCFLFINYRWYFIQYGTFLTEQELFYSIVVILSFYGEIITEPTVFIKYTQLESHRTRFYFNRSEFKRPRKNLIIQRKKLGTVLKCLQINNLWRSNCSYLLSPVKFMRLMFLSNALSKNCYLIKYLTL